MFVIRKPFSMAAGDLYSKIRGENGQSHQAFQKNFSKRHSSRERYGGSLNHQGGDDQRASQG